MRILRTSSLVLLFLVNTFALYAQDIPLPEHPRPDFEREQWQNLNGMWEFEFDAEDEGIQEQWMKGDKSFTQKIQVPFPWGSELSKLTDEADIGWYKREISISKEWEGKRTFLTIGAADWETHVWLDGKLLGSHRGGYVPFSFELTEHLKYGTAQKLVIRVDDARREFTLYGKQGYGNARGIWQTIYLEARGNAYLEAVHITPNIDENKITGVAYLPQDAAADMNLDIRIKGAENPILHATTLSKGKNKVQFTIDIPNPHLWNLEDPYLYDIEVEMGDDKVKSYFGMRKISTMNLPGTEYPYIAINNEPIYVQLALDQSYHPEGFYTFPSDQFMKEEIERSKSIGLNGIRTHIKVEVPRKLYWADKLGLLVMEDLPNSWGEPDEKMQEESEYTLREMIKRDFNHPSIFSYVIFNETWGLRTDVNGNGKKQTYLPETQAWVASMYYLAKSLDQTRIIEDNSICCGAGHTETDLNSWHVYLPGYEWDKYLKNLTENTYPGSDFDFEDGYLQGKQPNINSECGNVWGYDGSAGDVDWSWDYHRMMNSFRMYPKVGGWLYTEHHDVINEWNGYWRFDRTEKETGLGDMVEGMTLNDLHAKVYLSTGNEICETVSGGSTFDVPLYLSIMTGEDFGQELSISYELNTTNYIGETEKNFSGSLRVDYKPWMQKTLKPLSIQIPDIEGLAKLSLTVSTPSGEVLSRNFMHFVINSEKELPKAVVASIKADAYSSGEFSEKMWKVMDGKKINGVGKGFITYEVKMTEELSTFKSKEAYFLLEVSAKEFFVKDRVAFDKDQDYMRGSVVAPSSNPNSYPMTDETFYPSTINVSVNGENVMRTTLADDPADHRGVLSWHAQLKDRKLREAGSYGYLLKVPISKKQLKAAAISGKLKVELQTEGEGGIAVYGKDFGRYRLDPSLVLKR